jgi:hypothetical protein
MSATKSANNSKSCATWTSSTSSAMAYGACTFEDGDPALTRGANLCRASGAWWRDVAKSAEAVGTLGGAFIGFEVN